MLLKITEAYETLIDPNKKKEYDKTSHLKFASLSFSSMDFKDEKSQELFKIFCESNTSGIFQKLSANFNKDQNIQNNINIQSPAPKKGNALQTTMKIGLLESATSITKFLGINRYLSFFFTHSQKEKTISHYAF